MTGRIDVARLALMRMADSRKGEAMKDMEKTMISSLPPPPHGALYKTIMTVMERRWERQLVD